MIGKITARIGGGMLAGIFALAGSGSAAPQDPPAALQGARQDCARAAKQLDEAEARMQDALAALSARASVAPAIAASQHTLAGLESALAAVQDAADQNAVEFFESDSGPGWLGIRMEEVGSEKAKELTLPAERGALVTYVADDSPAAKAGFKINDVITEFDGQRVEGTMALERMVHEVPAGRSVSVSVWRDGHTQSVTVEIASRRSRRSGDGDRDFFYVTPRADLDIAPIPPLPPLPPMPAIAFGPLGSMGMFGAPLLGIDAEDVSGQLGNYFGAPDGQGILVREVMPGTPAEKAGLKAGDVILRVEGKRVKNSDELRSALREKSAKAADGADSEKAAAPTADLTVLRAGKETTLRVELQSPARRLRPVRRVAV